MKNYYSFISITLSSVNLFAHLCTLFKNPCLRSSLRSICSASSMKWARPKVRKMFVLWTVSRLKWESHLEEVFSQLWFSSLTRLKLLTTSWLQVELASHYCLAGLQQNQAGPINYWLPKRVVKLHLWLVWWFLHRLFFSLIIHWLDQYADIVGRESSTLWFIEHNMKLTGH